MEQFSNDCGDEFKRAMPEKPWSKDTPVAKFAPLVDLIEEHTQSDMFRHIGKYKANGDYYDFAEDLNKKHEDSGKVTFSNGVTAEVEQKGGWPNKIVIEDKDAHLKETLELRDGLHTLKSDKVEFCNVARTRLFGDGGEYSRAYSFDGGSIVKSGEACPVLQLDRIAQKRQ